MEPKKIKTYAVERWISENKYLLVKKDIYDSEKNKDDTIEILSDIKLYEGCEIELNLNHITKNDMFGEYYKISDLSDIVHYPDDLKTLNSKFSGKVVEHSCNHNLIKLDNKIKVGTKTISQVIIYNDDLLVAMKVENIEFEYYNLCNENIPVIYKPKYEITKEDLNLINYAKKCFDLLFFSSLAILSLLVLSFIASFITFLDSDNISVITSYKLEYIGLIVFIGLILYYLVKCVINPYNDSYKKDQLKEIFSKKRLISIFTVFILFSGLTVGLTTGITYKSDCVYDSEKKILITEPYFKLDSISNLRASYIDNRYIPIYSNYQYKILVKNSENLDYNKIVFLDFDLSFVKNDNLISVKDKLQKAVISTQEIVNKKTYQFNDKDNTAVMNENSKLEIAKIFLSELEKAGVYKNDIENYKYNLDIKTF